MSLMVVGETNLQSLPLIKRGKVRDIYRIDENTLMIVQTDRVSAFDVIMPTPIPRKGIVLTLMSNFWFNKTQSWIPNHLVAEDIDPTRFVQDNEKSIVCGRACIVKDLHPLPIEAVVRGYLSGSGWKEYKQTGTINGILLPEGMKESEKFNQPIFTPSTKAPVGEHDLPMTMEEVINVIGAPLAERVRNIAIECYSRAWSYAKEKGILIADTKFEFGLDELGQLYLIDEVLTPDSSRFWEASTYTTGISPPSYDKQILRNWLDKIQWNNQSPPELPSDIVNLLSDRYKEILKTLTGFYIA